VRQPSPLTTTSWLRSWRVLPPPPPLAGDWGWRWERRTVRRVSGLPGNGTERTLDFLGFFFTLWERRTREDGKARTVSSILTARIRTKVQLIAGVTVATCFTANGRHHPPLSENRRCECSVASTTASATVPLNPALLGSVHPRVVSLFFCFVLSGDPKSS
jgi:hypothetical protein